MAGQRRPGRMVNVMIPAARADLIHPGDVPCSSATWSDFLWPLVILSTIRFLTFAPWACSRLAHSFFESTGGIVAARFGGFDSCRCCCCSVLLAALHLCPVQRRCGQGLIPSRILFCSPFNPWIPWP